MKKLSGSTSQRELAGITLLSGLAMGVVVLGIGGRIVMRLLTITLAEPPRITLIGTLQVIGAGALWGALTGPGLLLLARVRTNHALLVGPTFGALVLVLAIIAVGSLLGFGGRIVAPTSFVVLSAILFTGLFVLHGVAVEFLVTRWSRKRT